LAQPEFASLLFSLGLSSEHLAKSRNVVKIEGLFKLLVQLCLLLADDLHGDIKVVIDAEM
jgi:hypothetical protein